MLELIKNRNFEKLNNVFKAYILHTALGQQSRPSMIVDAPNIYTIHIWAATVKNIVEASRSYTPTFVDLATYHREKFLAITVHLLCLAFHAIAYRGQSSVFSSLIGHATAKKQIELHLNIYELESTNTEESAENDSSTEDKDWDRDDNSDNSDITDDVPRIVRRNDHHSLAQLTGVQERHRRFCIDRI